MCRNYGNAALNKRTKYLEQPYVCVGMNTSECGGSDNCMLVRLCAQLHIPLPRNRGSLELHPQAVSHALDVMLQQRTSGGQQLLPSCPLFTLCFYITH